MQYFGVRASMIALAIGAVSLSACGEAKDNDVAMDRFSPIASSTLTGRWKARP